MVEMSRPISNNRALVPIPESSQARFTPPLAPALPPSALSAPSASSAPSDAMAATQPAGPGGMPTTYWWTPEHAACAFSTQNGRFPKRQLPSDGPWPMQIVRSYIEHDVVKKAQTLAKEFPELARAVTYCEQWHYLYRYWDAVDIWIEGAHFCYWVLHRLATVNKELDEIQFPMIDDFAKEWVFSNEQLVMNNPSVNDLTTMFDHFDRGNIKEMIPTEVGFLRCRLEHYRHALLSRVQELRRQASVRGPVGMMGPYPGPMFPPPHHNFPPGPHMIDLHRHGQPSPHLSHQTYNQFVENQRNLAARFGPRVPPNNMRHENRPMEGARSRGWSNDTARNGRGGKVWNNRGGRGYVPATPHTTPPRPLPQASSAEPIYVLTNQNQSPHHPPVGQRAFSDSSAGNLEHPRPAATPLGRRASTNDVASRPIFVPEKISSPEEPRSARSYDNTTPRARISDDARVLEAMERQDDTMFNAAPEQQDPSPNAQLENPPMFTSPPEQRPSNTGPPEQQHPSMLTAPLEQYNPMFNAPPGQPLYNQVLLQVSVGAGGPIHLYQYLGFPGRWDRADQNSRTVFLRNSPYGLFANHALKELCSQCGEVESISFLTQSEQAFVTFTEPSAARLAIEQLNGAQFGGRQLVLNHPKARDRGDSYSSQRSYASNRTAIVPRDAEHLSPHSRRSSFRDPYNHVRNISRTSIDGPRHARNFSRQSNEAFISPPRGLLSSVSEVLQHNAALNRMGSGMQMPLESIENHYGRNTQRPNEYRSDGDAMSQTSGYNNRKENSPMKSDKPQPMTPSRKSSFSSQGGGQGSKRKNSNNKKAQVSRQNSSTTTPARPTPAATPTKSRKTGTTVGPVLETTNASDFKRDDASVQSITGDMNVHCGSGEHAVAEKPNFLKRKQNKKKKNNSKNKDENATLAGPSNSSNASFATEASPSELTSPVETESSMGFTSQSTSTSFSTLPSRKPSVVSTNPSPPLSEAPEESDTITMNDMSPKTLEAGEKSITPKPSQSRSSSTTPDTLAKQHSTSAKTHAKKESVGSSTSTASSSMRKADTKVAKPDGEAESPEAKIALDDQKEFPSLGPVKSPVSSIADGKRPAAHAATQRAPIIGSLSERVVSGGAKNQNKPNIPVVAVPRSYMQRQAPQPVLRASEKELDFSRLRGDGLGSRTWPFVRRVRRLPL